VVEPNTVSAVYIFLPEVMDTELMRDVPWLSFFTAPPRLRPRTRSPEMRQSILALGETIRQEAERRPYGWTSAIRVLFYYLVLMVDRFRERPQTLAPQARVSVSEFARVLPAVVLVHETPAGDVALRQAAAACGLRRSRFSTVFQQTMGVTFGQFKRRAKLARVAYQLLTTDMSTDAIAAQTGFVDGSHLHRTFLQNYGRTPGQYRAEHRA
jgi:transcriptional regulator GlxA family with amidase domain